MNKAKIYPWVFAVVFGVVGMIIICPLVGSLYHILAKGVKWNVAYTAYTYSGGPHGPNEAAGIFMFIGFFSFMIILPFIFSMFGFGEGVDLALGCVVALILVCMLSSIISTDGYSPATGIIFSSLIGAISGWVIKVVNDKKLTDFWDEIYKSMPIIICWIFGAIIGGIFYNNGFIVSLPIVPAFASIGYAIGIPLKEKAEQRAEIKRREELEREWRTREEERRKLEYEQKIREYKSKVEQWEREGYDVSKLKRRWFK